MTTTDEQLRSVQARARERMNRDNPEPVAPPEPAAPPVFTCRECGERLPMDEDTARSLARWFPEGHSRWPCRKCDEVKKEAAREAREQAVIRARLAEGERIRNDLPGALASCGVLPLWRGASLNSCPDIPERLIDLAREWAHDPDGIVFISGPVGSGKSWLAVSMLAEAMLVASAPPAACRYISERGYLDHLKATFDRDGATPSYPPANDPSKATLLILDDCGSGYLTDWGRDAVAGLVEHRHGEGLPTIITSNLMLDDLASTIDGRTASRISEHGHLWELSGRDLRRSGRLGPAPVFCETPLERAQRRDAGAV
ncbi:MAG TPA: ATP-binding protein [Phycisphaerae bacterium]|nr:ATP-binding protein [Phycisphaerae bacterium]